MEFAIELIRKFKVIEKILIERYIISNIKDHIIKSNSQKRP